MLNFEAQIATVSKKVTRKMNVRFRLSNVLNQETTFYLQIFHKFKLLVLSIGMAYLLLKQVLINWKQLQ